MEEPNYILYVASYDEDAAASQDYEAIKQLGETAVVSAVVLDRDADGKVTAKERGLPAPLAAAHSWAVGSDWSWACSPRPCCWPPRSEPASAQLLARS